jgi:hypothetical protein
MPATDMARYMADRRAQRRIQLLQILGGRCVRCGTANNLEFDHIDATQRSFRINGRALDKPWTALLAEVAKCQLLCRVHHWDKTVKSGELRTVEHGGGASGKSRCSCGPCKTRKAEYMRAYGHPARSSVAQLVVAPDC